MLVNFCLVLVLLLAGMFFSVKTGKLTEAGAITGGLMGFVIFWGAGYTGLLMLVFFFIIGTAATAWKANTKENMGLTEKGAGRRTAKQALANAGVAAFLSLLLVIFPGEADWLHIMLAASLASATADTVSSELGNVYGRQYYNILSFKKDKRGLDGVVSLEGTLFGLVGSTLVAFIYGIGFGWSQHVLWIILAGTIGNLADSVLGATLERRNILTNDVVNFINTLIASLVALLLYAII